MDTKKTQNAFMEFHGGQPNNVYKQIVENMKETKDIDFLIGGELDQTQDQEYVFSIGVITSSSG